MKRYKDIKLPISEENISKTILSKNDLLKLKMLANYEGITIGRYVVRLIKDDIDKKSFLFKEV